MPESDWKWNGQEQPPMSESDNSQKPQQTQGMAVKILAAVYVGGAYGLILISLVQAVVLISWLQN